MARMRETAIIPEDIIVEIVKRLPIKPVGRCRCVCKRWRSLFSDPKFAKWHIQSASERQTLCRRLVLLSHEYKSLDLELGELKSSSRRVGQLNIPFKKPGHALWFLGSCNGLVACHSWHLYPKINCMDPKCGSSLFIWNPSTGFYKEIPEKGFYLRRGVSTYGFGHVSDTDDYVVLEGNLPSWGEDREVSIFSLRAQTRKSIKSPMNGTLQRKGVLLREALHWLACERDTSAPRLPTALFAFDLAKKEFRKMQVPSSSVLKLTDKSRLGVSCEGCLYIMQYNQLFGLKGIYYVVDFWVMREYGNSDSWTRSFSLKFSDKQIYMLEPILLMETCAFVMNRPKKFDQDKEETPGIYMARHHKKQENASMYILYRNPINMIAYEESLSEYHGVEREEGQKLEWKEKKIKSSNPLRTTRLDNAELAAMKRTHLPSDTSWFVYLCSSLCSRIKCVFVNATSKTRSLNLKVVKK